MADLEKMKSALRNAHNAGDTAAAKKLANAIKAQQRSTPKKEARWDHKVGAAIDGVAQGLTFGFSDEIAAGMASGGGLWGDYDEELAAERARMAENKELAGGYELAGQLAGGVTNAAGLMKSGVTMLAKNPTMLKAAGEGALYGAAHGFGAGEDGFENRAKNAAVSGAIGGVAAPVSQLATRGARAGYNKIKSGINSAASPKSEAINRVNKAINLDKAANPNSLLNQADDITARQNNQQLLNVDRGGENTRALARAAANQSPDARLSITKAADDRFATQNERAVNIVSRLAGGNVDDVAFQDSLRAAARKSNKVNYDKAYAYNFGQNHSPKLDGLLSRVPGSALRDAQEMAAADGVDFGRQLVASIDDATGKVTFQRKPNFMELDYIQRALRDSVDKNYRSGSTGVAGSYKGLHKELLDEMDSINPLFKKARSGASAAFGADNAVDAGRKFAKATRNTKEMNKAYSMMSKADKDAFKVGFSSEIIDKINSTNDRVNVIRSVFQSPEMRAKMNIAFGQAKAKELEAFVRVETIMDQLRGAMGNSTTARQLAEMGLVGGANAAAGGYGLYSGDYKYAALTGALTAARYGKQKVNDTILKEIGEILASGDPAKLNKIAKNSALSVKYMDALREVTDKILQSAPVKPLMNTNSLAATAAITSQQ